MKHPVSGISPKTIKHWTFQNDSPLILAFLATAKKARFLSIRARFYRSKDAFKEAFLLLKSLVSETVHNPVPLRANRGPAEDYPDVFLYQA